MAVKIKFYLDSKKNKKNEKSLYLFIRGLVAGKTVYYNTGIKLQDKQWNPEKQEARRNYPKFNELNHFLTNFKSELEQEFIFNRNKDVEYDKDFVLNKIKEIEKGKSEENKINFWEGFELFYKERQNDVTKSTLKKYITLKNNLIKFEKMKKYSLTYDSIDLHFWAKFKDFCIKSGFINNYTNKLKTILKTYLNWATERNYNTNMQYKKFHIKTNEPDMVALTYEELMKLYEMDLSKNHKLDKVRDIFCLASFTGQRYSDISNIKEEDIKGDYWYLSTQKTSKSNIIPLHKFAKSILNKYFSIGQNLPIISHQKYNDYLKELCKMAGIDEVVKTYKFIGNKKIEMINPKYELIGSHTGRRNFNTITLMKGMNQETVMRIAGITSYKTFQKYVKLNEQYKKDELEKVWG